MCVCVSGSLVTLKGRVVSKRVVAPLVINQTLITVRPTYLLPALKRSDREGDENMVDGGSKFASDRTFLCYGDTQDAVRGTDDITSDPVLTMEQEFARNDKWQNYRGEEFSAWAEWQYVTSAKLELSDAGSGVGLRDEGHEGWSVDDFCRVVNTFIIERVPLAETVESDGNLVLTALEVLAIRLYTGE
jgi:hypothetical protein